MLALPYRAGTPLCSLSPNRDPLVSPSNPTTHPNGHSLSPTACGTVQTRPQNSTELAASSLFRFSPMAATFFFPRLGRSPSGYAVQVYDLAEERAPPGNASYSRGGRAAVVNGDSICSSTGALSTSPTFLRLVRHPFIWPAFSKPSGPWLIAGQAPNLIVQSDESQTLTFFGHWIEIFFCLFNSLPLPPLSSGFFAPLVYPLTNPSPQDSPP